MIAIKKIKQGLFRYKSNKGEITLLFPCLATFDKFEIYSQEKLFEDVERYFTQSEAEERINDLLN